MSIKVLYAGSPEASAKTLEILFNKQADCGFQIAGVLTNPPTAKGRHKELTPTACGAFARQHNIPVFELEHLDTAAREAIAPLQADILVSFAYGHIFGPKFLALFPCGGINLHPSLLPKYRGCTPVPAAILNRDKQTAISVQTLSLKMDEGDILSQKIVDLNGTETGESLLNYSAVNGAELLCIVLSQVSDLGKLPDGIPQQGGPSYTGIITKDDGKINWSESAEIIDAKIRAYYPDPGCWCMENNVPLKILEAKFTNSDASKYTSEENGKVVDFVKSEGIYIKTGNGLLCVTKLQRQGKNAMNYKDFMNGARNFVGSVLQ